jgi:hypothetical protein
MCEIKTFFENVPISALYNDVSYATDARCSLACDDFKLWYTELIPVMSV